MCYVFTEILHTNNSQVGIKRNILNAHFILQSPGTHIKMFSDHPLNSEGLTLPHYTIKPLQKCGSLVDFTLQSICL